MRALVYNGPADVAVSDVPDATIVDPNDAVIRITTTNICGSDLHMYEGRTSVETGKTLGHENMGVVEEVGPGVSRLKKGDRVVLPFNIGCGHCRNCQTGHTGFCTEVNPGFAGGAYGYADMGPYSGGQAEALRVPWADWNALRLPQGTEHELDYTMLSDVLPTGWHGTRLAGLEPGDSCLVMGAGPVGLMAALSAMVQGASQVFVVDRKPDRLALAEQIGATAIDFSTVTPTDFVMDATHGRGVDRGVEAVGFQAHDTDGAEKPDSTIQTLVDSVRATGGIGVVGLFVAQDPQGTDSVHAAGNAVLPFGSLFTKGQSIGTGQANVKAYNRQLRDLITHDRITPSWIVSQELDLEQAAEGYRNFDDRLDGWTRSSCTPPPERPPLAADVDRVDLWPLAGPVGEHRSTRSLTMRHRTNGCPVSVLRRAGAVSRARADEVRGRRPQFPGGVRVQRPLLDSVAVVEQVCVVGHGVGFASVVEVVPAGVGELRRDRRDEGRGGALLDGLVGEDPGCFRLGQVVLLLLGEVPLQARRHPAGVDGVHDDAVGGPSTRGFDREQRVGGLGLGVRGLRVVGASPEVDVVEDDRGPHVCGGAHRDDTGSVPFAGSGGEGSVQAETEREVAEVVGGELEFPPLRRPGQVTDDHAGVVDQQVQRTGPPLGERGDGATDGEVQRADEDPAAAGRLGDVGGRPGAGVAVADGEGDLGARSRQRTGCLHPDPGRCAGDDRAEAGQVQSGDDVGGGAVRIEPGGDQWVGRRHDGNCTQ